MKETLISTNRRKARRLVRRAMAGAALGVGLMVLPALAANPVVNTTSDVVDPNDGLTSLREAINAANADSGSSLIEFSGSLGADPTFTLNSALPSITTPNSVVIDTSAVGSITLPQVLTTEGGNVVLANGSTLYANVTAGQQSTFALIAGNGTDGGAGTNSDLITGGGGFGSSAGEGYDGFAGDDVNVTGDVNVTKSTLNVFSGVAGDGGNGGLGVPGGFYDVGGNGGFGGDGGSASITGDVTANDSTINISGSDGGAGGNGGAGQNATPGGFGGTGGFGADGGNGGHGSITGHVTATNSSITMLGGDAGVGGNGGNGDSSVSEGGTGGSAGNGGDGGSATIANSGTAIDATNSTFELYGGDGSAGGNDGAGGGAGGIGGDGGFGGIVSINGDLNATKSTFALDGGDGGADGDSSFGGSGGAASITGSVTADRSTFTLNAGNGGDGYGSNPGGDGGNASITGDVDATNSSFTLTPGEDGNGGNSGFGGDAFIDGNFTASGSSNLSLTTGITGGFAYTTEDVTLNDTSKLYFYGTPELNFNGGNAITTFGSNATLVAPLDFSDTNANYLTVNHLALNDSRLQTPWTTHESTFNIGETFHILDYNGDQTGEFGHIYSPLTFDVDYGSGSADAIDLSISGLDYTQVDGNTNQRSLEGYLNRFQNTIQGQINLNQADLFFDLPTLTQQLSVYGPGALDYLIPDNLAAHNAQTYANQKAFVDAIGANLRNTDNQTGASPFALNQISGMGQSAAQMSSLRQALNTPLYALNANGDGALPSSGAWASYNGAHSSTDADHGLGSHEWSAGSDGYTVGYTGGTNSFRWGLAAGHQKSTLSFFDVNASGEIAGYNAGLYAAWKNKSAYLTAILGYGDYKNDAYGTSGDLHFTTKALSGSVELGKHIGSTSSGFTPYASLLWTHLKNGDATDTGSGLTLKDGSSNVYSTALGLRYTNRMYDKSGALKGGWEAGAAWLHQFGDTDFSANAGYSAVVPGSFRVQTTPLDGNALQVRLGAYGRIHGNLIGFAGYQGTFGSSQKINAVNAGVGYQF